MEKWNVIFRYGIGLIDTKKFQCWKLYELYDRYFFSAEEQPYTKGIGLGRIYANGN